MKFPKRLLAWMLSAVMVFGLAGTMAFANETETSSQYNHGTIAVKADDSNGTITMVKGGSAEITVSPYVHVQYQGCQMPGLSGFLWRSGLLYRRSGMFVFWNGYSNSNSSSDCKVN